MNDAKAKERQVEPVLYEFLCARCGASESLRMTEIPRCRCGFPMWPIARVGSSEGRDWWEDFLDCMSQEQRAGNGKPEYSRFDHPHTEFQCQICALRRQSPGQHRLWCRVFRFKRCNCDSRR